MKKIEQDPSIQDQILVALSSFKGNAINLCFELNSIIKEEDVDNQHILFKYICENFGIIESNEEINIETHITDSELEYYKQCYGDYVDGILKSNIKRALYEDLQETEFYKNLWTQIRNIIADKNKEKVLVFAFYYILIDKRIPYFKIGQGLKMNNEEFKRIQETIAATYRKINFILNMDFEQKTEEGSLILDEILKIENYEKKVVLFTKIIHDLKRKDKLESFLRGL